MSASPCAVDFSPIVNCPELTLPPQRRKVPLPPASLPTLNIFATFATPLLAMKLPVPLCPTDT
jgi:hypothetical protein